MPTIELGPNERELLRNVFASDEVAERVVGDEDIIDALLDLAKEPPLAPHVVHVEPTFVEQDCSYWKSETEYVEASETVRRQVVLNCPDCGTGLTSRGFDMLCPRLAMNHPLRGHDDHPDVIACGAD